MSDNTNPNYYPHKVGDGRHLVNDTTIINNDGSWQIGDPSDPCVLRHVQALLDAYELPPLWQLWTQAYTEDPMTEDDQKEIISAAESYTVPCDPTIGDDRIDILLDLINIGCAELATLIKTLLKEKGTVC